MNVHEPHLKCGFYEEGKYWCLILHLHIFKTRHGLNGSETLNVPAVVGV